MACTDPAFVPMQAMCLQLRDALRVGCIGLYKNFFCNTLDPREMLKVLEDEMKNFCVLVEAAKTPFGKCASPFRVWHTRGCRPCIPPMVRS